MVAIRVGHKGSFICQPEETILAAGQRAGFGFPKACRNGNCGRCAGQLLNGCVLLPQAQQSQINSQTKTGHVVCAGQPGSDTVLYCIAKALSDCDIAEHLITAPGELPVNTLRCQIADIRPLNHNVSAVSLRLPAGQKVHWHAGQYLLLGEKQEAAFSIANSVANGSSRELLLHIRHEEGNASATALMAELREHATALATLPLGERYIDQAPQQPIWFICGSTGFAPARAMIDRKSTRLNSSHVRNSYAVFCLKKKTKTYSFIEEAFPETQNYADTILVGYTDLYFYLTDMLDPFINKAQLQTWGISKPAGMVLYGPPGSGKIYWAKKIASMIGYEFVHVYKDYLAGNFKTSQDSFSRFLTKNIF